jgi:hypothetical protein
MAALWHRRGTKRTAQKHNDCAECRIQGNATAQEGAATCRVNHVTLHSTFYQLSVSLGGGFIGAFLLKIGFSLTQALLFYAALLTVRMGRFCALVLIRRLGYKYTMIVGVAVSALQSVSLIRAEYWQWLALWIATLSLAESLY